LVLVHLAPSTHRPKTKGRSPKTHVPGLQPPVIARSSRSNPSLPVSSVGAW
jgi:hypothetical protein